MFLFLSLNFFWIFFKKLKVYLVFMKVDPCPFALCHVIFTFSSWHCVISQWCSHVNKHCHCQSHSSWFGFKSHYFLWGCCDSHSSNEGQFLSWSLDPLDIWPSWPHFVKEQEAYLWSSRQRKHWRNKSLKGCVTQSPEPILKPKPNETLTWKPTPLFLNTLEGYHPQLLSDNL